MILKVDLRYNGMAEWLTTRPDKERHVSSPPNIRWSGRYKSMALTSAYKANPEAHSVHLRMNQQLPSERQVRVAQLSRKASNLILVTDDVRDASTRHLQTEGNACQCPD